MDYMHMYIVEILCACIQIRLLVMVMCAPQAAAEEAAGLNECMVDCDFCNFAFHLTCARFKAGHKCVTGEWDCLTCLANVHENTQGAPDTIEIEDAAAAPLDYLLRGL